MAARLGRKIHILLGDSSPQSVIKGVQQKTLKCNSEAVDITNDDDNGWRTYLSDPGTKSVDISINGMSKEAGLLAEWFNGNHMQQATIVDDITGERISGAFFLASYQTEGPTAGAVPFSAELNSSGEIQYDSGSP